MADVYQINMIACTATICDEIKHPAITQRDVAMAYALAIKSEAQGADKPDWRAINTAILNRWSMSGLERIKKRAMDILAGKVDPSAPMHARKAYVPTERV